MSGARPRVVAVTRILNEADIVEAFVRHHATMVDRHILLDNGSVDRTVPILRALREEGLPLVLAVNRSVSYCEIPTNTALYHFACTFQPDWVIYLDADEFIDIRTPGHDLRGVLAGVPADRLTAAFEMVNYLDRPEDDPDELCIPERLRFRQPHRTDVWKIAVRAGLALGEVTIGAGNHEATHRNRPAPTIRLNEPVLAHFAYRSGWQSVMKFAMGWLKVTAAGAAATAAFSGHYRYWFERLRDAPESLFLTPGFIDERHATEPAVADPIPYRGGPLRYTQPIDPRMITVSALLSYGEALARQHGRLIDENAAIRAQVDVWNNIVSAL